MTPRILFATSNGTGLGHLTRSMAIARRLDSSFEALVLTLSAAAPVVREAGFAVEYVASYNTPGSGSDYRWSRRLRGRLRAALSEARPDVLVFDGAHPYQALLDAMPASSGTHRVWCRRPMWKPGSNPGALARTPFFDAVLEPGEFAADHDRGPTVARRDEAKRVAPIVFCEPEELLPRADAERELGLAPGRLNVLVQLGQGAEVRQATERCLRHLAGREGVQVAALSSAIAGLESRGKAAPEGVVQLRSTYPMSRYYSAFDAAVSAAGYNAYHELIHLRVPSLFVPMRRETDDQAVRARHAASSGVGRGVEGPGASELERMLDELLDREARQAMRGRLAELQFPNGAGEAARWLERLAVTERRRGPRAGVGRWRRYARDPLGQARKAAPFLARLPRSAAAVIHQELTRPKPRTVMLALGAPGQDELERGLAEALAQTPDPPERVLVVTDSLAFAPLRAAGVGFEHVPARGEPQAEAGAEGASEDGYEGFLRRRLALILAERPRPRRVLTVGDTDAGTPPLSYPEGRRRRRA